MNEDLKNSIRAHRELFKITGHPVFGAIMLYSKRTGNIITLEGLNKEHNDPEITL